MIDVDVVYDDREKIFEYIKNRFGESNTARVAAYGTLVDKSVIDEVGRALARGRNDDKYSLQNVAAIKEAYAKDTEEAREKWPELFYYFDGLVNTRVSQSVHPAGMVISPICLDDLYGVFMKDGERCLLLDMDEAHEVGLIKYDLLALKTVQVIRDTCKYLGLPYPKTSEINFDDQEVWNDMVRSPGGLFQFEGKRNCPR